MKLTKVLLVLTFCVTSLGACKETSSSNNPSPTTYTFTSSTDYSFAGTGTYNKSFSTSLPAATAASIFSLTQTGVLVAASRIEDNASGFTVPSTLGQPADGSYTAGYSAASSSTKRELILFRSTNSNLELYAATRASTSAAVSFSKKTTLPSQSTGVVSMAETGDGEYILLVSGSGTTHKVLKRGFSGSSLADTFSVTTSAVGSTISTGVKALSANLNNSSDSGNDRNEYEFILVGSSTVRVLTPDGNGLYVDSAAITRSSTATIKDAALVNWDGDQYPDLILLTLGGIEFYKNQSTAGGAVAFAAGTNLLDTSINLAAPTKFLVTDLNADQFPDLVIFRTADAPLYLQFSTSSIFVDKTDAAFGSALNSDFRDAVVGDFNGDSRMDIAFFESDGRVTTFLASN